MLLLRSLTQRAALGLTRPLSFRSRKMSSSSLQYICVLDFEATCDENSRSGWDVNKQEIIEFPVLRYNVTTREVDRVFHEYVRPTLQPTLTKYCNDLTGIEQHTVDAADAFPLVWARFVAFMAEHLPEDISTFAFLTCGSWDLKTMLPRQLALARAASNVDTQDDPFVTPRSMEHWLNIKTHFKALYNKNPGGMKSMMHHLKLDLEGRHHSGIDDCKNIARIITRMLEDGWQPAQPRARYN